MVDDLNRKLEQQLADMEYRLQRMERGNPLESASVTSGRVRFIGGTLRVDSGGSVQIVGTLSIDGTTNVSGTFTVSGPWNLTGAGTISGNVTSTGTWTQNGPWNLNGTGTIAGNTTGTGTLTWTGPWNLNGAGTIAGNTNATGTWTQTGPWTMNGAGTIAGNVTQTGNTTQQGTVTLTGANGRIIVTGPDGNTVLKDSKITFPNGSTVNAEATGAVISQSGVTVGVVGGVARMRNGTKTLSVFSGGFAMTGLPTVPKSSITDSFVGAVVADNLGNLSRVVAG